MRLNPEFASTGAGLRYYRKAARLTQADLAELADTGRHAVQYWEARPVLDRKGWAVSRMIEALAAYVAKHDIQRPVVLRPGQRVICGAKTRKGTPCRCKSEPGKRRCKFHGGMSTGPKTPEGRQRIAEAQRRRWHQHGTLGAEPARDDMAAVRTG